MGDLLLVRLGQNYCAEWFGSYLREIGVGANTVSLKILIFIYIYIYIYIHICKINIYI